MQASKRLVWIKNFEAESDQAFRNNPDRVLNEMAATVYILMVVHIHDWV